LGVGCVQATTGVGCWVLGVRCVQDTAGVGC